MIVARIPNTIPPLPEAQSDWIVLGQGGTFNVPERGIESGLATEGHDGWNNEPMHLAGDGVALWYAAPPNSPVVLLNLPPLPQGFEVSHRGRAGIPRYTNPETGERGYPYMIDLERGDTSWNDRGYVGEESYRIYLRHITAQRPMRRPDPTSVRDPLPEGAIYLGRANTFSVPGRTFMGYELPRYSSSWRRGLVELQGNYTGSEYAAPANSEVARAQYPPLPEGYEIVGHGGEQTQEGDLVIGFGEEGWNSSYSTAGSPTLEAWTIARRAVPAEATPAEVVQEGPRAVRQWGLIVGSDEVNADQIEEAIASYVTDAANVPRIAKDLDEALRRSDPEISIEHWIDLEPTLLSIIEFVPLAQSNGVDIQAIAESNAAISDVIIKAAAGVMLRGGFSDHFRYLEDGTLVIDPSSPPTVDQAYEMLKRTLETKETASKLENYSAWMLGMIADQFEGYFQDSFDPSVIMEQTSRAYNTYICSLKTFRSWWADRRPGLSFTHHREVEYAKHLDHDSGGKVLDMSQKFGLTVLQQRKLISYAKRFDLAQVEAELEEAGTTNITDLMERIDIRAVNKRYLFFLRTANRWYEYKGPFENIPNGASPIINVDTRELMGQDGRANKAEEWVPVGTIATPAVLAEVEIEQEEADED